MRTMKIVSAVSAVWRLRSCRWASSGSARRNAWRWFSGTGRKSIGGLCLGTDEAAGGPESPPRGAGETAKTLILAKNFDTALIMLGRRLEYDPKLAMPSC